MSAALSHRRQRLARKAAAGAKARSAVGGVSISAAKTPRRAARTAAVVGKIEDRDGLLWLIHKNKLSAEERRGCEAYRAAYRHPAAGSIRSQLDPTRGDGSGDLYRLDGQAEALDAARRLERYRSVVLAGDAAAIMLMDAVCGGGLTVQAYLHTADSRAVLEATTVLRMSGRLIGAAA